MHRLIQDHLEEALAEPKDDSVSAAHLIGENHAGEKTPAQLHLEQCQECRDEVNAMRAHAALLRALRANREDLAPRSGFYARVMERIEAQGAASIWQIFAESAFSRRIAVASMALAVLLGTYLVSSERTEEPLVVGTSVVGEDQPGMALTSSGKPDNDTVLVNLVTYREQ